MIERVVYLGELYDLYRPLLTARQREVFELYYLDDLSLGEIAEECGISRQGVHDLLRRSEKALLDYEKLLGVHSRRRRDRERIDKAIEVMDADPEAAKATLREILEEEGN